MMGCCTYHSFCCCTYHSFCCCTYHSFCYSLPSGACVWLLGGEEAGAGRRKDRPPDRCPTLLVEGRQVVLELEEAPPALAAARVAVHEAALRVEFGRVHIDLGTTAPRSPGPVFSLLSSPSQTSTSSPNSPAPARRCGGHRHRTPRPG